MKIAIRIFGAVSLLVCAASLYYKSAMILMHWSRWPGKPGDQERAVFFAIISLSTGILLYVTCLGFRLVMGDSMALKRIGWTFIVEIAMYLVHFYVTWMILPPNNGAITIGLWGIAMDGVNVQVLSGYALLGAVAAFTLSALERRRLRTEVSS